MSFSSDVKDELIKVLQGEEHCRIAELSALFSFYADISGDTCPKVYLSSENAWSFRKCFTLLSKTFNIRANDGKNGADNSRNGIELSSLEADTEALLKKLCIENPMLLLDKDCCKRAYLRGAFLGSGFINDPSKSYHFEILTADEEHARLLTYLFSCFNIAARHSVRKKYHVIYIKEAEAVSDALSVLGAHKSMMGLANARIEKNVRNNTNRRINCDIANVSRSVNAASKQIEDIQFIRKKIGLDALPDSLREMALIRVEYPEESFADLGNRLNPPVGKSGVNHRLRKISEFADELRGEKEKL